MNEHKVDPEILYAILFTAVFLIILVVVGLVVDIQPAMEEWFPVIRGTDVLTQQDPAYFVFFYATGCPYCVEMEGVLNTYRTRPDALPIYGVEVGHDLTQARAWDLRVIPTILKVEQAQESATPRVVAREEGVQPLSVLQELSTRR